MPTTDILELKKRIAAENTESARLIDEEYDKFVQELVAEFRYGWNRFEYSCGLLWWRRKFKISLNADTGLSVEQFCGLLPSVESVESEYSLLKKVQVLSHKKDIRAGFRHELRRLQKAARVR